ncbi:MAG: Hsp70 family protein [Ruminococcus sp.]|jgi:molecular chaperone DnaK|nr:Hsp70 family protein [Ruminococcus sp.]
MSLVINKVVGIDLGTTNSVISLIGADNKTFLCLTDKSGRKTFPSVLAVDRKTGNIVTGQKAFAKRGTNPEPITSIKRHMGDSDYTASVGGKTFTPIEVSAEYLRAMKEGFQEQLSKTEGYENYEINRAVITIPAYFRSDAAEATAKAGELAGFEVMKTLQEPSSACAYYCYKNGVEDGIFMVYDLGGGTFDVSIVRYVGGEADVLGISGNNYLGGDTFDELLAEKLIADLNKEGIYVLDLEPGNERDNQIKTIFKLQAEGIKKNLSSVDEFSCVRDALCADQEGQMIDLDLEVTRAEFEELIKPALAGTLDKCNEALAAAEKEGITLDDIEAVLLVGGSSHIPYVREFVRQNYCDPSLPHHTIQPEPLHDEPDMSVGYGAAVAAQSFTEKTYEKSSETGGANALTLAAEVQKAYSVAGKSKVDGKITAITGKLPAGLKAVVSKTDGSFTKEFGIEADGKFTFNGLPAPGEDEPYFCSVELNGKELLTFNFNAAAVIIRTASATLSHPLLIELINPTSRITYRKVLMENGTNLPASEEYTFHTTTEYSASFKIFEENTQLCFIKMKFANKMDVGTPVTVRLEIDEKSTKHVFATSGGVSQDAVLEAPQLPPPPESDFREAMEDYESILRILEPSDKIKAEFKRTALETLKDEGIKAVQENDQTCARTKLGDMQIIIDSIRPTRLNPPESAVKDMADECMRLNREYHDNKPENIAKIKELQAKAAEAYRKKSQDELNVTWKDFVNLRELLDKTPPPPPPPPEAMWMVVKVVYCQQVVDIMEKAKENSALPSVPREGMEKRYKSDEAAVIKIRNDMSIFTTETEAEKAKYDLGLLYRYYEPLANYTDTIG